MTGGAARHPHPHAHDRGDGEVRVYSAHLPDHDHAHDDEVWSPLEDNPIWQQDNVTLHSVGIDIGSSGTQVLFSRLHLRRIGEELTSRYVVVRRETLYRSPVALTPYADTEQIDAEALGAIIDAAYGGAGIEPGQVDTGVVILTGEALRRRNAELIAMLLAERGGELVTATAGHHMEALLAAYGSGAARLSYERDARILNVDIGGGTTKLAVTDHGRVEATAAVHVGGRLLAVDRDGRLIRLEPRGRHLAARAGHDWRLGDVVTAEQLRDVAASMADLLIRVITSDGRDPSVRGLLLTDPPGPLGRIDGVLFSGGVAEYVYDREQESFGDLGLPLGRALSERIESGALPFPLLPAQECIRATALGASEYSVQLSGNTGWISDPDALLPRRNVQVVKPRYELGATVDSTAIRQAVERQLRSLDAVGSEADLALALSWSGPPSYERLIAFARGVRDGLAERIARGAPLYLLLDGDIAMTLGRLLREELDVPSPVLVVDCLALREFDYIDLGRVRFPSNTVPVTIKSLVFQDETPPAQRR